jgi:hypothetical protein
MPMKVILIREHRLQVDKSLFGLRFEERAFEYYGIQDLAPDNVFGFFSSLIAEGRTDIFVKPITCPWRSSTGEVLDGKYGRTSSLPWRH